MSESNFHELQAIMTQLRSPQGCPWIREQSFESLRKYIFEESHELVEAINEGDTAHICQEAGDLLFQVLFVAQIAEEKGLFNITSVTNELIQKLRRRNPHVFADPKELTIGQVCLQWQAIKKSESEGASSHPLGQNSEGVPLLNYAERIGEQAASYGFDWPDWEMTSLKIEEELAEVRQAAHSCDADHLEDEVGDLLFAAVQLARKLKVNPQVALHRACQKFKGRFNLMMEPLADKELPQNIEQWIEAWKMAKERHREREFSLQADHTHLSKEKLHD